MKVANLWVALLAAGASCSCANAAGVGLRTRSFSQGTSDAQAMQLTRNATVDYSSLEPAHSALPAASQLACPIEEFHRYSTILCSPAFQRCSSEWCREWKADWIKKFGACATNGCAGMPA
mmetsp:Transcript_32212/g.75644  ORF Transcript_32212/g.75644 Transcript_32212/m.75644 type:complete len:120 (-) Transcript_32212:122-481(-)